MRTGRPASGPTSWYRWYVLAVLHVIYVCNVADRLVLSILVQDIKRDLAVSDWSIGLLIGPVIALFYAVLGIPMARIADRVNRVRFLAICIGLWSLLTAAGGAAANAMQLGFTRLGVSAVEAGGGPASSSIIADYFPPDRRPAAMGVYAAASMVGILLSFGAGGLLSAHLGWRWTLVVAGLPGAVLSIVLLATVREPARGALEPPRAASPGGVASAGWRSDLSGLLANGLFRRVLIATGVANFCANLIINWGPALVIRRHLLDTQHAGLLLGSGMAICGGAGTVIAGRVISRLSPIGLDRPLRLTGWLQLLAGPLMLAAVFSPSAGPCIGLLCAAYGLQSFFVPMYWSVSQSEVRPDQRASAAALMLLSAAILGTGLSAPLVGALSDLYGADRDAAGLQRALATAALAAPLAAILFWSASRAARKETSAAPARPT